MRLRNKKWAEPLLNQLDNIAIKEHKELKGKWKKRFNNDFPIYLEIGMGKGDFICGLASNNPSINFIGIERATTVCAIALKKINASKLENVLIMNKDASLLEEMFEKEEIDRIFLNFSDPWPKKRTTKKRLTYKTYLDVYSSILKKNGLVIQKTDNKDLFDFSVESFKENNWEIKSIDYNYPMCENKDDVPTEYERRFREQGKPIYRLIAMWKGE